ncbi:MAG: cation:proton antiporter [Candidatus Latescibacteria bacterium 4484_7]|nr:MAG: cation:proton antiporter [Candidatus Latescibacteria bacterium 4484_7]
MVSVLILGFILIVIGFWGILVKKNMIKIVLGIAISETGLQLSMISIGYIYHRTAPILNDAVPRSSAVKMVVDPVPQALVLTAIVIGVAVNALLLSYVISLYKHKKSLNISDYKELKW